MATKKTSKKVIKKSTETSKPKAVDITYELVWRNEFLTTEAKSIAEMAKILRQASDVLLRISLTGKVSLLAGSVNDDYATFVTDDAKVAKEFCFDKVEK